MQMQLWVLISLWDYDAPEILGIYSTEETAKEAQNERPHPGNLNSQVWGPFELDTDN